MVSEAPIPRAAEGCPTAGYGSRVRLFVAVPSAAHYTSRRQAIRATWCARAKQASVTSGGQDSAVVAFFVGTSEHDGAIRAENAIHRDLVMVPVQDAATNVTAKLLHSLHYFSQRDFTHYIRVEDDVYPFVSTIIEELEQKHIRAVPRPYDVEEPFLWALIIQGKPPYPAGSGFVLSADVVRAITQADAVVEWDTGAPAPEQTGKPSWGKGGWRHTPYVDGSWST